MENKKSEGSNVLLGLSHIFDGDIEKIIDTVVKKKERPNFDIEQIKASQKNDYITILDTEFPKRFNNCYRPPLILYYKGDLSLLYNTEKNISLLNSKNTCNYATESLIKIVKGLNTSLVTAAVVPVNDSGAQLVSRVIESGIKVIAVSDRALDANSYSDSQKQMMQVVLDNNGLIISEIPDNSNNKSKQYYLMRLISLCASNVLVGAITRKDSLIHSVAVSMQLGNDIYCIPFSMGSNYINNELIRDGAFLAQDSADILLRHQQ